MPKVLEQMFETKARPNVNTGDPAMDRERDLGAVIVNACKTFEIL